MVYFVCSWGNEASWGHQAEEAGALCDAASAEGSRAGARERHQGGAPRPVSHPVRGGWHEEEPYGGEHCRGGSRVRHRDAGRGGQLKIFSIIYVIITSRLVSATLYHIISTNKRIIIEFYYLESWNCLTAKWFWNQIFFNFKQNKTNYIV